MPEPSISVHANVRATRYFIAHNVTTCGHCHQATSVFALGLPSGHEMLDESDDDIDVDDDLETDMWSTAGHCAFLFYVAFLPEAVRRRLEEVTLSYRADRSQSPSRGAWANHCEHCDQRLDDQDLFCEPGAAFCPFNEIDARDVLLLPVKGPLEADAAGYVFEPPFFDAMSRV